MAPTQNGTQNGTEDEDREPSSPSELDRVVGGFVNSVTDTVSSFLHGNSSNSGSHSGSHSLDPKVKSEIKEERKKPKDYFKEFAQLIGQIRKPLPTGTGNGTDLNISDDRPGVLDDIAREIGEDISAFTHLGVHGDLRSLMEIGVLKKLGQPTDDKRYLMEAMIKAAAGLPETSKKRKELTDEFITRYLGKPYQYRQADGSYNSLLSPHVGKANTPYARTAKPAKIQIGALPDPGVIFDSVMARKRSEKHPNRISSMLFYLASIIIHDIFRTDREDFNISKTSSYLDLSPLYEGGKEPNGKEVIGIRTGYDGKIKADTFAETRLLSFPPGVSVLLIMFNRFHNFVVEQLAMINEKGRFPKPEKEDGKVPQWTQYDEDLFQHGRLVTSGLYINIILTDYVRTILNLQRTDSSWNLDPRIEIKDGPPMGVGNQCAAEFNLVYRWHSTVSDRDEKWTEELWKDLVGDKKPEDVTLPEFRQALGKLEARLAKDPGERSLAGLKRQGNGTFKDEELVKILKESIEDCANSFGAQRVPKVLRLIEILGIEQARSWDLASLNEFRKYFGLTPHETFESINDDPEVAKTLKHLYDHPDLVELYPGLVVEKGKKPMTPGSGLCPSYTVSRAVLSDAVAVVRGDRFYTIDYHPKKLTNWGFAEVHPDPSVDHGCMFYKLILRAFPDHFEPNSIYAHYPLTVPEEMRDIMIKLEKENRYSWAPPQGPPPMHMTFSYAAADRILGDKETFNVTWGKAMEYLMGPSAKNFMLSGDGFNNEQSRREVSRALYNVDDWEMQVKNFYETTTLKLIKAKGYKLGKLNQVDIIRDVGNLAHVHFCSELFFLPLKTKERPGVFSEYELYLILSAVFVCVFFDLDKANSFNLRLKAHKATQQLGNLVQANVAEIKAGGRLSRLMQAIYPRDTALRRYGIHLIDRLLQSYPNTEELVWGHILGTAGGMVPNQGQLFGQTIEYFLTTEEGRSHLPAMKALADQDTREADEKLMHYFLEGSRLYGETGVFRRATADTEIQDKFEGHESTVKVKKGDIVMVNLRAASHDEDKFKGAHEINLNRPIDDYIHLGAGPHQCLGLPMTRIALTAMLKTIVKLPDLWPAAGPQGKVHKIAKPMHGHHLPEYAAYHAYLTENHARLFPFPCSLKVNWSGDFEFDKDDDDKDDME
ncbi:hypothetical protein H2199_000019 [Coniosporium tulheliwenetii]|uniref:Uncharacterized protein n=1 Tax=Coniosporium tulheliwenetii TaxID=3383036 RepID=A0ACC2ZNV1_9PEZI|nr:hypothetical protein H2199_000019 [Cladosporium sp. JES 115]